MSSIHQVLPHAKKHPPRERQGRGANKSGAWGRRGQDGAAMGGPFLARTHTPRASARQQQGGGGRIARSISEEGQGSPTLRHAQLRAWGVGPGDLRCPRTGPRRGNANAAARCRDRPCAAARRRHSAAGPAGGACSHTPARVVQQNSGSSRVQPALPPPVRRAGGGEPTPFRALFWE